MNVNYILVFFLHVTYAQFPEHTDFQKVGEIILNNEKYKILKPRVHKVTDHFKDFMLRRENKNPDEKIFIDDNGFRHFWSGLGRKYDNLRKTDILLYQINKHIKLNDRREKDNSEMNIKHAIDNNKSNASDENSRKAAVRKKPKRPKTSLEQDEEEKAILRTAKPAATVKPAAATVKAAAVTVKPAAATVKAAAVTVKPAAATTKQAAGTGGGKKIAKVSFFCPFFGVMTMTSFID